jgi:hypothetical protein
VQPPGELNQIIGHPTHGRDDADDLIPRFLGRHDRRATFRIRSGSPTEVPPYFWTMRAIEDSRREKSRIVPAERWVSMRRDVFPSREPPTQSAFRSVIATVAWRPTPPMSGSAPASSGSALVLS